MDTTLVSIVIPSYMRAERMRFLLSDVFRQEGSNFEVIVVDDCSSDKTVDMIRNEFPAVRLMVNRSNGGPAVSRNRGILAARGGVIVGFDSDVTLPDTNLLASILARFENHPEVEGLALRIRKRDGVTEDSERWWHPLDMATNRGREFFTSYFSGTAYAFRRNTIVAAGLFPEWLYMHYEEVELAWRVLDRGGRILYSPDLVVIHYADSVSRRSEVEVFFKPRNQVLLAASCMPWAKAIGFLVPRTGFQFLKALVRGHIGDFLRAMKSAWDMVPTLLATRKPLRPEAFAQIRCVCAGDYPCPSKLGCPSSRRPRREIDARRETGPGGPHGKIIG